MNDFIWWNELISLENLYYKFQKEMSKNKAEKY